MKKFQVINVLLLTLVSNSSAYALQTHNQNIAVPHNFIPINPIVIQNLVDGMHEVQNQMNDLHMVFQQQEDILQQYTQNLIADLRPYFEQQNIAHKKAQEHAIILLGGMVFLSFLALVEYFKGDEVKAIVRPEEFQDEDTEDEQN